MPYRLLERGTPQQRGQCRKQQRETNAATRKNASTSRAYCNEAEAVLIKYPTTALPSPDNAGHIFIPFLHRQRERKRHRS